MAIVRSDEGEPEYVGQVLALREIYGGFERDNFQALVPDGAGGFTWYTYRTANSVNGQQDSGGFAEVDAPDTLRREYEKWTTRQARDVQAAREQALEREVTQRVEKGKEVEVYKGRKVPVGTFGEVIWLGAGKFGTRVGLKDRAGKVHWTALENVRVLPD